MTIQATRLRGSLAAVLMALPWAVMGQEDPFALEGVDADEPTEPAQPVIEDELTLGLHYHDDDAYRFGKYTGATDAGVDAVIDLRLERRPQWDSGDTLRWRLEGWRLGLDSRRLLFDLNQQGTQSFTAEYRGIPSNRFDDGVTPYRGIGTAQLTLPPGWEVAGGSNNTAGLLTLQESLARVSIDTQRRRLDLAYERKLGLGWRVAIDYRHETKKGERPYAGIFGYTGGNPRAVILPAPVDYATDNLEAMFSWGNTRMQFGFGAFASWFSNNESSLVWQNAFGRQPQWAPGISFPDSEGRLALEPDNSFIQFKAYGGVNLAPATRLTADVAIGEMKQNELLLPYTINPNLLVHTPVPIDRLDGEIDTTVINLRLTTRLMRRLALAASYRYDERDNHTPQAVFPYIGGDSQDQRPFEDGRINLPYSYEEESFDVDVTLRLSGRTRLKAGVEWSDYARDYSEVTDSDEFSWTAGVNIGAFETASLRFDYRASDRDVDAYIGNAPFIQSHVPGSVGDDEFENHPLLRKYNLTDREREEYRFRADFFPVPEINLGLAASRFDDEYDDGFFGLSAAEIQAFTADFGWYPRDGMVLTGYYTREKFDAEQSARSFSPFASPFDPANDWFAESSDDVDTWNLSLSFADVGAERGWSALDIGFDWTVSNTESQIDVAAPVLATAPVPELRSRMHSISGWVSLDVGKRSSIRLAIENQRLDTDDFSLDGVMPDTLANVLTLGEAAANYDVIFVTGSFTLRF